jgi:hypothetical protein
LSTVLQIVPRVPGGIDGVGDYALTVSRKLRDQFECRTVFAALNTGSADDVEGFEVRSLESVINQSANNFDNVLLHYVNYGFQKRGVPFRLISILRALRKEHRGRFVAIFHELYASGPPWQSEFWLQPLQIHLAKQVGLLSDYCIVSSESFLRELRRLVPAAQIELHPVPSSFGEPSLSPEQIANRDPHRWALLGGNVLLERSLRGLRRLRLQIPEAVAPRKLFVIGGHESATVRSLIDGLGIESTYCPQVAADDASQILRTCAFVWFDYFHRPDVDTSIVLKSSAFASACAHAVIPVFPHATSAASIHGDALPGPFFVAAHSSSIPNPDERARVAVSIYDWYQRYAASEHLVQGVAQALGLKQ